MRSVTTRRRSTAPTSKQIVHVHTETAEDDSVDVTPEEHIAQSIGHRIGVNVVLAGDADDDTLDRAAEVGFECANYLDLLGIAHGTIDSVRLDELRSLPGVESVERDREEHIWSHRAM